MLSSRVPRDYTPNPLAALLEAKRAAGRPVLDLTGTNPTQAGLPTLSAGTLAALSDAESARYDPDPRGRPEARRAIAAYYAARCAGATAIDPGRIFLTASTSEAYAHLFRLLCDPEDEVVAPRPSYPLLEPLARIEHVRLRDYRLTYDGRWALDLESLEAALGPRTRAVVVVEPNNPTGSRFTATERVAVESICADRGIAIISDEVFGDFPWPPRTEPLPGWNNGLRVPTFVLGGISKLCGLPQMKLGWIAACGPEAALRDSLHGLEWIADLFLSVGAPVQVALPRLLEDRVGFHAAVRSRMEATLTVLRGRAGRSAFTLLEGEGGWSAILRFADRDAEQENVAEWALRSHDVLLHPGHYYDLPREDDAVISLLTEPAIVKEAIGRLGGWGHSGPVR